MVLSGLIKSTDFFINLETLVFEIGMANYMSKHIGDERYVKSYDMLVKDQVINSEIDMLIEHPNREYHLKQMVLAHITSGKGFKVNSCMIPKSRTY